MGGARFRILGGGGGGGARGDKLFAPPNQCQIIRFLTLKIDNLAKLRTELKSIPSEIPSNKIKGTNIKLVRSSFYYST